MEGRAEAPSDERACIAPILPERGGEVNSRLSFELRRPRTVGARGTHGGDRHLRARDGVRQERPGVSHCANPPSDYASGQDLFGERAWPWLVPAGRHNFALVEPERVTIVWPTAYEIRDGSYRLIPNATLPREQLRAALEEMRRFYRP